MGLGLGNVEEMARVLKNLPTMAPTGTFVMDPLVARSLVDEGFKTKRNRAILCGKNRLPPSAINFMVVGGQTNPLWITTVLFTETEKY